MHYSHFAKALGAALHKRGYEGALRLAKKASKVKKWGEGSCAAAQSIVDRDEAAHPCNLAFRPAARLQKIAFDAQAPILIALDVKARIKVARPASALKIEADDALIVEEQQQAIAIARLNPGDTGDGHAIVHLALFKRSRDALTRQPCKQAVTTALAIGRDADGHPPLDPHLIGPVRIVKCFQRVGGAHLGLQRNLWRFAVRRVFDTGRGA